MNGRAAVFLPAPVHGGELNGTKIVKEVVARDALADRYGAPRVGCPGLIPQHRYAPVSDEDLTRLFPGNSKSTRANRTAQLSTSPTAN